MKALNEIMDKLNKGYNFGKTITNARFPYFSVMLAADKHYIHWSYFGSSANKNNLDELKWIIEVIFETSPENFIAEYEAKTNAEICKLYL